jgi:hypothetical protein
MSYLELARDALKQIPMADLLRERLQLALDRLEDAESQKAVLQAEKAALQAALDAEKMEHKETKQQLRDLEQTHGHELRFSHGIEFRRGLHTGGVWLAFCPACHLPADLSVGLVRCGNKACKWSLLYSAAQIEAFAGEITP